MGFYWLTRHRVKYICKMRSRTAWRVMTAARVCNTKAATADVLIGWRSNDCTFSLHDQMMSSLPDDIFEDTPRLAYVNLKGNRLTTLNQKAFSKRRVFYDLRDNFINCNCNIKWVTTHGNSYSKNMLASCAEPTTFRLQQLDDLEEDDFDYCE
ncbi:hypothetical protein CEXT_26001 [Caerostris extrusa]|uniref:Uncharacterized protein n=1 Tax=Caerostris extrusa TaxID=172846 RepID=A0AAV4YD55_CAEEX|nr:hypothetical protein CEXT_26001 [Caerostris extrusa]